MLQHGYNFVDGSDDIGGLNAGLFFIAYVRDPRTHFIPVQRRMASSDALMETLSPRPRCSPYLQALANAARPVLVR